MFLDEFVAFGMSSESLFANCSLVCDIQFFFSNIYQVVIACLFRLDLGSGQIK